MTNVCFFVFCFVCSIVFWIVCFHKINVSIIIIIIIIVAGSCVLSCMLLETVGVAHTICGEICPNQILEVLKLWMFNVGGAK